MGEYKQEIILFIIGLVGVLIGLLINALDWNNTFVKGWFFIVLGLMLCIFSIISAIVTFWTRNQRLR